VDGYLICRGKKAHRRQVRRLCSVEGGVTNRGIARILDFLRHEAVPGPDLLPDAELLRRYHATRDEAAFELLVRRHGPMVWGVARRVLRDEHAAEDAFQATFLALVRKAKSLRRHDALAGWLYRIALRTSYRARPRMPVAVTKVSDTPAPPDEWSDLKSVLDEEVDRLPERFRMPVVLCYLSGRTTEEAARQLGCPRGSVLSRLRTARERLRARLMRRGYGVPAAAVAAVLAAESAPAGVSGTLVTLALKATAPTGLAPGVVALTEGVYHAMWITKAKITAATLLTTGLIGIGAAGAWGPGSGTSGPHAQAANSAKGEPASDDAGSSPPAQHKAQLDRQKKADERYREKLSESFRQRVVLRTKLQDLQEAIELHQRELQSVKRQFEVTEQSVSLDQIEVERRQASHGPDDPQAKQLAARLAARLKVSVAFWDRLKTREAELRKLMRPIRHEIIACEEDIKLQEQLTQLELRRLEREQKD